MHARLLNASGIYSVIAKTCNQVVHHMLLCLWTLKSIYLISIKNFRRIELSKVQMFAPFFSNKLQYCSRLIKLSHIICFTVLVSL